MEAFQIVERQREIDKDMDARQEAETPTDIQRQEIATLGLCYWLAEISLQLARLNKAMEVE
ncbi:MAG: hypothetical protein ABSF28_27535 [Terracidiphilus sp.]|jgi:hypothetical protein